MKKIGLYIHIPFCRSLCHYCDFVKTANWDKALVNSYFESLERHLDYWLETVVKPGNYFFPTVFFGGGTPSLFTEEYRGIFQKIKPFLLPNAEITFEANPDDLKEDSMRYWRDLGVNRLSVGVQSFCGTGLKFLTRQHSLQEAEKNFAKARKFFPKLNIDMIYGWQNQDLHLWHEELDRLIALQPNHVSLYLLTYAQGTPIGRAHERGKLQSSDDTLLESLYLAAKERLAVAGFVHEEVSNWSKEDLTCEHNWLYWKDQYYVAIGAGACGYVPHEASKFGLRYKYLSRERSFCQQSLPQISNLKAFNSEQKQDYFLIEERSDKIWLLEYIGVSLRHSEGVSLKRILEKTGFSFVPNQIVQEALKSGLLTINNNHLILESKEWFREMSWCLPVFESFK